MPGRLTGLCGEWSKLNGPKCTFSPPCMSFIVTLLRFLEKFICSCLSSSYVFARISTYLFQILTLLGSICGLSLKIGFFEVSYFTADRIFIWTQLVYPESNITTKCSNVFNWCMYTYFLQTILKLLISEMYYGGVYAAISWGGLSKNQSSMNSINGSLCSSLKNDMISPKLVYSSLYLM